MDIISFPSQNYNNRAFEKPDMIVIHYTGMQTAELALERMCDLNSPRVSAHYFIHKNGMVYQLVDEKHRAWHAGVSSWEQEYDINSRSIGIELDNKGHEFGYHAFPAIQIQSLIRLLDSIRSRYDIADKNIIGHSDIAPMRKQDPGYLFPWHILARYKHGLSPKILKETLYSANNAQLFENLSEFGYLCDNVSYFTQLNRAVYKVFMKKIRYTF